ncbi:MAG TPA: glutamine--tRNA ligase, partial [Halothiobacillaceae bacterium]|nr:glutamine--tRNA ligase [Halothiobacillaceae bacterium]
QPALVRQYDRLFKEPAPGGRRDGDDPEIKRDFLDDLNPDSIHTLNAYVEPDAANAGVETVFQFERHGYFVTDSQEHKPGQAVFNRTVTLRDSWAKKKQ